MFAGYHIDTLIKRGLKVGKNFNLQAECFIDFPHCWLITIGDNVTFAPRVHILAHDTSARTFLGHTKVGLVNIGNRVFVGNDAIIMPGVSIGDDVIIGAGSVVTKDVPSGSVYAGNPAKLICTTKEYLNKTKELLGETPVFGSEYTIEKGITEDMKQHMIRRLKESGGVGFI
ncbi:acyltransferase [Paenibacillus woosongensis]|uniref:Acyltransferase n=2 Tax=Paenibacillus woosongensis TaxID=307580 RepID=A0A7X3CLQ2_9BACL|nr:acyltransferase [Paenibacillus woosongensis]